VTAGERRRWGDTATTTHTCVPELGVGILRWGERTKGGPHRPMGDGRRRRLAGWRRRHNGRGCEPRGRRRHGARAPARPVRATLWRPALVRVTPRAGASAVAAAAAAAAPYAAVVFQRPPQAPLSPFFAAICVCQADPALGGGADQSLISFVYSLPPTTSGPVCTARARCDTRKGTV